MKTIRSKLIVSMSAAMLVTVFITVGFFIHLIDDLIMNQAKTMLQGQVSKALKMLNDGNLKNLDRTDFKYALRGVMLNADYIVLDHRHNVVAASNSIKEGTYFASRSRSGEGIGVLHGIKILYSQAELKGTSYLLLIYSPLSSIRALSGSILQATLLAIAYSFGVILCIGLLTVSLIVKPLNRLKENVSRYEPNASTLIPFPAHESGEIGELGRTFQHMAERISRHHQNQVEFLQNVSHELKTPLMSIQGYAYAIRDGIVPQEEGLQIIDSQSHRLVSMVDKLLLLSRLEATEEIWPKEELDIHQLAKEAVGLMLPVASERDIKLTIRGDSFQVTTTGEQMFRILVNLLQNAVRHTQTQVVVTTERDHDGWMLHVDDDGSGITEEARNEIFGRFVTGANGVTGLGLAISRQITLRLGAELVYSDSPLGGARFSFIQRNSRN